MTEEIKLRRVHCNYKSENARFLLDCDFSKQYSNYYNKRLERTRPFVEFNCRLKWPQSIPILKLTELASVIEGSSQIVDGVLIKSQSQAHDSSPETSLVSSPVVNSFFKYSKRFRKFSESSPAPKSSTQKQTDVDSPQIKDEPATPEVTRNFARQQLRADLVPISPIFPISDSSNLKQEPSSSNQHVQEEQKEYIIIGTIFKRMKLQPDVVQEISEGNFHINCERYLGHYTTNDDKLVLEDPDETIMLVGNIEAGKFVTGVVVAILGYPIKDGSQFYVKDICFPEPNKYLLYDDDEQGDNFSTPESVVSRVERPITQEDHRVRMKYLMVVSGFGFNHDLEKESFLTKALQNMIDFIWGGGMFTDDERSSQVARILVVGGCLSETRLEIDDETCGQNENLSVKMKKSRQVKPYLSSMQAIKHMDNFFAQLSKTIEVDVMPGPSDPSSHLMPQQPFHPCMFPKSCMFPTFNCTTNPHYGIYDDKIEILATSGQNVDIVSKFSALSDPIEIMKCHLKWGNSAPSAPDNLYSAPYEDEDPFIIDFIPDIYIAGCQDYYRHEYYHYSNNNLPIVDDDQSQEINKQSSQERKPVVEGAGNMLSNMNGSVNGTIGKKDKTLLLTVPKFHETFSCVLVDLETLEPQLMSFKIK